MAITGSWKPLRTGTIPKSKRASRACFSTMTLPFGPLGGIGASRRKSTASSRLTSTSSGGISTIFFLSPNWFSPKSIQRLNYPRGIGGQPSCMARCGITRQRCAKVFAKTLVILSVHGNNLFRNRLGIDVEAEVSRLILRLLSPLTLDKLLSHDNDLPRYAEAAPREFLNLLEADLQNPQPEVLGLLKPVGPGVFSDCPRTGLLWALECLAWKNLGRVEFDTRAIIENSYR